MKACIIAEHNNQSLKPATLHVLTAAKQLAQSIDVLVIGYQCQTVASEVSQIGGVSQVLVADQICYEHQLAENTAALIAQEVKDYDYVLTAASTFGKNLLPRVAALLNVSMVSDVAQVVNADTFVRPMYAGNILATVQTSEKQKLLSIRGINFAANHDAQAPAAIKMLNQVIESPKSQFVSQQLTQSERPELTNARVIISGGRGLKSAENFKLLDKIADRLGAAVGASRAAVDAGFAPNDYQVGQTGKVVAPDLYIAVGISGAIQHLAGMKESKVIVAINNDPEAPIFEISNYKLVGDLFKILPELEQALKN
jgi:electron transfer flavoprotein alpha subunit